MAAAGFAVGLRDARATSIVTRVDSGSGLGKLIVYTGTRPATGAAVTVQVTLGTLTFAKPCGVVANGVLTFNPIAEDSSADATGTATWARITNGDDPAIAANFVMDVDVGISGSGAQFILNTTSISAGGPIRCESGTITEGNP